MASIGLLGGAFDPVHNGHLAVARAVLAARGLGRVDLLVSGVAPHRKGKRIVAPAADRLAMAALAADGIAGLGVEDCETRRAGRSFTIDTIRELKARNPGNRYEFILGADMVADLPRWREPLALLREAALVPVMRPGVPDPFVELERTLGAEAVATLRANLVSAPLVDVASRQIRAAVAAGESIAAWVPAPVAAYIAATGLYRGMNNQQ